MTAAKERAKEKLVEKLFSAVLHRMEPRPARALRADPKRIAALRIRCERAVADAGDHAETALRLAWLVPSESEKEWSEDLFRAFTEMAAELRRQKTPKAAAVAKADLESSDMF
jgi:hypothetical protein